jgi:ferrochelatase
VIDLPVYFGNRNWEPYVEDTVAAMRDNGIRRAAVFTTSAWGGYSSCTQYVEDIARARAAAGEGAPELVKLRQYFDHPLFVEMFNEAIGAAAQRVPDGARLVFTAHSIPVAARPGWPRTQPPGGHASARRHGAPLTITPVAVTVRPCRCRAGA